jgi:hypothetical protein
MAFASKETKGQQGPKALLAWTLMAMAEPSKTSQTGRNVLLTGYQRGRAAHCVY